MAVKRLRRKARHLNTKLKSSSFGYSKFSKKQLTIFGMAFLLVGGYLVFRSFATTSTANLWVDTNGGTCTRQSPGGSYNDAVACGSFQAAYIAAQCGDMVGIKQGDYSSQTINTAEKECSGNNYITFTPATGEVVNMETVRIEKGDWVKFLGGWPNNNNFIMRDDGSTSSTSGFYFSPTGTGLNEWVDHIWVEGADFETFLVRGSDDITFKHNDIGPGKTNHWDEKNWVSVGHDGNNYVDNYATNLVIDGNDIHGYTSETCRSSGCHTECLSFEAENFAIRNNRIWDCGNTAGITMSSDGGFWSKGTNYIENNFIHDDENAAMANGDLEAGSVTHVRFNSFQGSNILNAPHTAGTYNFVGNVMSSNSVSCSANRTFSYNIVAGGQSQACGSTDLAVSSTGYAAPPSNLHLTAGAAAINFVPSGQCSVSTDIDGEVRPAGSACDAGADEFDSTPADAPKANIWIDKDGGTCTYSSTPVPYDTTKACSNDVPCNTNVECGVFDDAWDKVSSGDTIIVKPGTYGTQMINGDKTSETKIIGEGDGDDVILRNGGDDCMAIFGAVSSLCAQAAYMTLENVTLDSHSIANGSGSARIWEGRGCDAGCNGVTYNAHHVTLRNVDFWGDYPNLSIQAPNFTWQNGSHGKDGVTAPPLFCGQGTAEPVWIEPSASHTTLDGIRFNPKVIGVRDGCTPHLENIRIQDNPDDVTIKNSWFVAGTDAGSGHIFTGGGGGATNVKIINNYFEPVNGSYGCQCTNGSGWTIAYNTFKQAFALGNPATWVGNLGTQGITGCEGTHIRNVWQGSGSCGSDTYIGNTSLGLDSFGRLQTGSPAINAAETNTASDYCTGTLLGSVDRDGDTRPSGSACDAGADEYTGSVSPTPPPSPGPTPTPTPSPTPPPAGGTLLLGSSTVQSTADSLQSQQAQAWPFTANSSGFAATASLYLDSTSSAQGVQVGLYANSSGAPGSLLATATINSPVSGWNTASLSSSISITSGTQYWIGVLGTGSGTLVIRSQQNGSCTSKVNALPNNWTSLKNPFGATGGNFTSCPVSAYISASSSSSKQGDLNNDGLVNIFDLSILLTDYGKTKAAASNPACDINNDNNINIFDMSILLSKYGT